MELNKSEIPPLAGGRRAKLAGMTLGEHPVRTHSGYLCRWGAHETKEGRYREFDLPEGLVPYMNHYLDSLRPELLGDTVSDRVWISVRRSPMSEQSIYDRVTKTAKQIPGNPVRRRGCDVMGDPAPPEVLKPRRSEFLR